MEVPQFDFDFTFLDSEALRSECISTGEIIAIFYDTETFYQNWSASDGFSYMMGYTPENKFVSFTFEMRNNDQTVRITSAFLSRETEIRFNYYGLK